MIVMQHWAWLGVDNISGPWYAFWSGIGADIPILFAGLGLVVNAYVLLRRHNCAVHGCWRICHHVVAGHAVCRRHYPIAAPSVEDIAALHLTERQVNGR